MDNLGGTVAVGSTTHKRTWHHAWAAAREVPGWMTKAQGRLLWDEAQRLGEGAAILEIGSHQGRSTMVLGNAAANRDGRLIAIDPFVDEWHFGGQRTRAIFEHNVAQGQLEDVVELLPEYSNDLRPDWDRPIDLLYIDGNHDLEPFADDLRWKVHLPHGASVLVHDSFSAVGVTLGILRDILPARDLIYVGREGSLALFRIGVPTLRDRLRIISELPWWVRNLGIKVLLRLGLRGPLRLIGHHSPYDPY